jgi:hypothetical protein
VATTGFHAGVARVLRPGGRLAAHITGVPPRADARTQVATARAVFADVAALGAPAVLRGRRAGNLILLAGALPALRPIDARVLRGADLAAFGAGARPVTD